MTLSSFTTAFGKCFADIEKDADAGFVNASVNQTLPGR